MIRHRLSPILLVLTSFVLLTHTQETPTVCWSLPADRGELVSRYEKCALQQPSDDGKQGQILSILNRVLATDPTLRQFVLDSLALVKLASGERCFSPLCNVLLASCEYSASVANLGDEDQVRFERESLAAASLASKLTALSLNEKVEGKVFLSRPNIYSLIKLGLLDYASVYDIKVAFFQEKFILHAAKNLNTKVVKLQEFKNNVDNSKAFDWYTKWSNEKRLTLPKPTSSDNWEIKQEDLRLDASQTRQFSQLSYLSTDDLNAVRYTSGIKFDCAAAAWSRVVSVPFVTSSGEIRGVVATSISLNSFDINQCGGQNSSNSYFYNTDQCDPHSTQCVNVAGKGFVLDSYRCQCLPGFYSPNSGSLKNQSVLSCQKCASGCNSCLDHTPCQTDVSPSLKKAALIINLICIGICILLALLTWYHMTLKVLKTSSPKMLFMVLLGAIVSYSEIVPMYLVPSYWTCTAAQILQLEGFLLAYGALVMKTWRDYKIFFVRSVKSTKITDVSLMKRLGVLMLAGTIFIVVWVLRTEDSPRMVVRRDNFDLKYETCSITVWNFVSMSIQLAIVLWGAVLSIQVRRASIAFKETKLITWAIFNEGLVLCLVISVNAILKYKPVPCVVPFVFNFIRIHLTISIMILLLFSYKIYKITVARRKPFTGNQRDLLNNCTTVAVADVEQKSSAVNEETDKERELKVEISRLYRQIEEMRSLSMRIANPHLIPKKHGRFGYQTKKIKLNKNRNSNMQSEHDISRMYSSYEPEAQSLVTTEPPITSPELSEKVTSIQLTKTKK